MSERVLTGYLPPFHPAQIEIASDHARYRVVSAGRRFGKGILGISAAFRYASRGGKCRWIAPSYASDSYQAGWRMASVLANQIPGVATHLQKRQFDFSVQSAAAGCSSAQQRNRIHFAARALISLFLMRRRT